MCLILSREVVKRKPEETPVSDLRLVTMETRDPRASPPGLVSQDDVGLWMKLDSSPVRDSQSVTSGEKPQAAPAVITRYYTVMDDEGTDDVFIPPPLPPPLASMFPLLPTEGSTEPTANNSSVTLSNKAADATEDEANPRGLDWHHGEKQLMATQVNEATANTAHISKESKHIISLSNDKNSNPATDQDPTSVEGTARLMETCNDPCGTHHQDRRDGESNEEPEDTAIVSDRQEDLRKAERNKYPKQTPSNTEENSENETDSANEGEKKKSEDISGFIDKDSNLMTGNTDCDGVGTNTLTLCGLSVDDDDDDFESSDSPELHKRNQNKMDAATNQPQVPEIPVDVTDDDQELVDTRSLNYNLTKNDWVRRETGTGETRPISDGSEEIVTKGEQGDGIRKIATDIQQGEQLLQRLQLVQQQQDVHMSESPLTSQQAVQETGDEEKVVLQTQVDNLIASKEDQQEESRVHTVTDEGAQTNLMESKETKPNMCLPTKPEHQRTARTEAESSDHSDSWVPHETSTTKVCVLPARHRFSAAETSMEIQEAAHGKQNLQRAGGVFNLADNPDVLEIPFQTNISLKPFPPNVGQGQGSDWQFSEQKMQKEISHEIQRELVLVNQGKIPGGYSKGEVRQLKETKMLFEAFQQVNTEGPTRHRRSPTLMMKGHVYPSVLERTQSLEMFSLKSCPITRAHSLRLYKSGNSELEKSPENIRSRSPTGGSRDKTRLSPYPKKDKHLHVYRSMDSLSPDVSTSAVETRSKMREGNVRQESPILKRNPFFKLRPALALQPEVEKDIREAREREEELRRQRCTLYGENRQNSQEEEKSHFTKTSVPGWSALSLSLGFHPV